MRQEAKKYVLQRLSLDAPKSVFCARFSSNVATRSKKLAVRGQVALMAATEAQTQLGLAATSAAETSRV